MLFITYLILKPSNTNVQILRIRRNSEVTQPTGEWADRRNAQANQHKYGSSQAEGLRNRSADLAGEERYRGTRTHTNQVRIRSGFEPPKPTAGFLKKSQIRNSEDIRKRVDYSLIVSMHKIKSICRNQYTKGIQ